jgi:GTP-binding protein
VTGKIGSLRFPGALCHTFADCVVVLIDASMEIERQDLALSDLVATEGRAVVLALSKWDLVDDKQKCLPKFM